MLAAALVIMDNGQVAPWLHQANKTLPYVILGIGILIGLRFHRSRLAFTVLLLILSDRALHYFGPGGVINSNHETAVFHAVGLLLPLNIAILCLSRERGMLNVYGMIRLFFIGVQPLVIYTLLRKKASLFAFLDKPLIPLIDINVYEIPDVLLLVYSVSLLFFLSYALISNKAIIRGFFWALLSIGIALYELAIGTGDPIFFSVAGIIVILSLLETAYIMAYHDELTGLPARRSLNTALHTLGRRYTIAMLDIDFFKKFNDKYGHDVGDQVLCMVASHINKVGGGGKPFRYGGEEFTVIFPGKSKLEARPYLEKLRQSIAQAKFKLRSKNRPKKTPKTKRKPISTKNVSVTISIGSAEPVSAFSKPTEVLKSADKALYQAKKKGRNCTI